ncbi:MAG TPA: TonB-dependent receptor plug domain-containing protein [Gemmatimonadaceae bacterium]|jgi:TonB-dependent SusC/RagA subfamily outer membrane receptor
MRAIPTASSLTVFVALSLACASPQTPPPSSDRTTVSSADHDTNEPIEKVLQRKFPGVRVSRTTDGSLAFQIRGSSSYTNRDTPPLFVVNGTPVKAGPNGELVGVDPYEIDTVKVLTGAESGIYGIDGANGVILITTKRSMRTP